MFLIDVITTYIANYIINEVKKLFGKLEDHKVIEKLKKAKDEKEYENSAKDISDLMP